MLILEFVLIIALIGLTASGILGGLWYAASGLLVIDAALRVYTVVRKKRRRRPLPHVDETFFMSGKEFESYVGALYEALGYKVVYTSNGADQGVDVIVKKGLIRTGLQAKCYNKPVSNKAVQEAAAGKKYYRLNKCVVITNSVFTPSAVSLAAKCRIKLIDRKALATLAARANKNS